jgi:hypothetical protein
VTEYESQESHSGVEREWPVAVRPFLSPKRVPHFKTRRSLRRTKIWSWGPIPRTTVLTRANSNLPELPPSRREVTSSSQTLPLFEEEAPFKARDFLEKKNTVMGPDEARNQELLCWRGLTAIRPTEV